MLRKSATPGTLGMRRPVCSWLIETLLDAGRTVPRKHLRRVNLVGAFKYLDLLGAPLLRGLAVLGSNLVRVHQFLRKAGGERNGRDNKDQKKTRA